MKIEVRDRTKARRLTQSKRESDRAIFSRTPVGLREMFAAANEVPLAFLGFASTFVGGMVLWSYFKSVGYIPDDIAALLSLGIVVTGLSLLFLTALTTLFLMPALILKTQGLHLPKRDAFFTLVAAITALYAVFITPDDEIWLFILGSATGAASYVIAIAFDETRNIKRKLGAVLVVSFMSIFLFFSALLVTEMSTSDKTSEWLKLLVFTAAIIIFILLNTLLANDFSQSHDKWIGWFILAPGLVILFLYQAPTGTFLNWAASSLGIRLNGIVELVVPESTCKSIASRVIASQNPKVAKSPPQNCNDFGNQLKSEVKVRLGRSWLVCVRELNGVAIDKPFTMTISSTGTELIVKSKTDIVLANSKSAAKDDSCDFSQRTKSV